MGSSLGFWRLQLGGFGLFRPMLCAVPNAHGNAEEVCHSVSQCQPKALFRNANTSVSPSHTLLLSSKKSTTGSFLRALPKQGRFGNHRARFLSSVIWFFGAG
jgi:hypothetical protein